MTLILAIVLSAGLDAATTCMGLSRGLVELNPLYGQQPSCSRVILIKGTATTGALFAIQALPKRHRKWAKVTLLVVNVVVVGWNIHQLRK